MTPRHFRRLLVLLAASPLMLPAEDERPVVDDLEEKKDAPVATLPTLWIAGDSTVKNQGKMRGWGQDIATFLDPTKIHVVNRAIGGRSSRTFFTEGRWDEMLKAMKSVRIAAAHQVLTIASADLEVARLLELPMNAPVAEVRRVFKDAAGTVIYLADVTYRGDAIRLEMDLQP